MKLKNIILVTAGLLISGSAFAGHSFTAQGRVVHSSPVYKIIEVQRKDHHCRSSSSSHSGYSQPGRVEKHGKLITSPNTKSLKGHSSHTRPTQNNDCGRGHIETKRILKGFDVTYRYKGDTFHTFTKHKPGRHIVLNVSISPQFR